jgi:hypothetical protein
MVSARVVVVNYFQKGWCVAILAQRHYRRRASKAARWKTDANLVAVLI